MPTRPYTDITVAKSGIPIKNGGIVTNATVTGFFEYEQIGPQNTVSGVSGVFGYHNNIYSTPAISALDDKYGNRFYNGIFVKNYPSGLN